MKLPLFSKTLLLSCALAVMNTSVAQPAEKPSAPVPEWMEDARLGIFIHWGVYAVNRIGESWPMRNGEISVADYMDQLNGFTAANYDPQAWARLFAAAGADYAVLTAKHHDGVALWDTEANDLSVAKHSPAGRDLVGPFCEALRAEGLRVGLYYSHLDWSHPDYNSTKHPNRRATNTFEYRGHEDPAAWERFLVFHRAQMRELAVRFRPDYFWFDGAWERTPEQWRIDELVERLAEWAPGAVLNNRIGGGHGVIGSVEQSLSINRPAEKQWEFCLTTNDNWSPRAGDENWKSPGQLVRLFVETVSMGGKMLLNVAPLEDGTIPAAPTALLQELGAWNQRHREAIWGAVRGVSRNHVSVPTTVSRDGRTLYAFIFDQPRAELLIKGLETEVRRVTVLDDDREIRFFRRGGAGWSRAPYLLWIDLPSDLEMGLGRVVKIELVDPIKVYRGDVGIVDQN